MLCSTCNVHFTFFFLIWTKNLMYISQLTSNNIISCCKSHSELYPFKTATAFSRDIVRNFMKLVIFTKLVWNRYIVFTSVFPVIHCAKPLGNIQEMCDIYYNFIYYFRIDVYLLSSKK